MRAQERQWETWWGYFGELESSAHKAVGPAVVGEPQWGWDSSGGDHGVSLWGIGNGNGAPSSKGHVEGVVVW